MYFKVVLEGGHAGAGRSYEMVRYFEAENAIVLLKYLETYPALKHKGTFRGISLIKPVSREEYEEYRERESFDPYSKRRKDVRFNIDEECFLICHGGDRNRISCRTMDYSNGGMKIYLKKLYPEEGTRFSVTVESLGIKDKDAVLVWCRKEGEKGQLCGLSWC